MHSVMNYTILQRNDKGYAAAYFSGELPQLKGNEQLVCRVIRETDNAMILYRGVCGVSVETEDSNTCQIAI